MKLINDSPHVSAMNAGLHFYQPHLLPPLSAKRPKQTGPIAQSHHPCFKITAAINHTHVICGACWGVEGLKYCNEAATLSYPLNLNPTHATFCCVPCPVFFCVLLFWGVGREGSTDTRATAQSTRVQHHGSLSRFASFDA